MSKRFVLGTLVGALWAASAPAMAQSADLSAWGRAGDVVIDSITAARLTTAAVESAETPLRPAGALLYFDLEPALGLAAGTLPADTFEGSGLHSSFDAAAVTTIGFDWALSTEFYDAGHADRGFVVIDGSAFQPLGEVGDAPVSGQFSHTFGAGRHALAFGLMDVDSTDLVSTLTVTGFNVSAVPEPASGTLALIGLGGLVAAVARRRRGT